MKSRRLRVLQPGLMLFKFRSVRTSRPAPERTRIASATCAITRAPPRLKNVLRDAAVASAAELSLSAGVRARRILLNVGARPNKTPVKMEAAVVKARTRKSKCAAKCDGHNPP